MARASTVQWCVVTTQGKRVRRSYHWGTHAQYEAAVRLWAGRPDVFVSLTNSHTEVL